MIRIEPGMVEGLWQIKFQGKTLGEAEDNLFLELSRLTKARTEREIAMLHAMKEVRDWLKDVIAYIGEGQVKEANQARIDILTDLIAAVEQDGPYRAKEQ